MKSLVSLVNVTGSPIVRFGTTFSPGVPVVVYRNRTFLELGEDLGHLIADISERDLVGYAFDGTANSPEESVETLNSLVNRWIAYKSESSYSARFFWLRDSSSDILDGLRGQLISFDWSDPDVTIPLDDVLETLVPVVTYLSAGFLDFADILVQGTAPDGDSEFLSAARLNNYKAIFASASR